VIGYSLRGAPKGRSAELIAQIMAARSVGGLDGVVSLDNPSGLNVTTGATPGLVVEADATMTLCLPKTGLRSSAEAGRLYLADISVPPSVTSVYGPAPDFHPGPILEVIR
jgi:NAD(P)H-hydrate epimerase